MAYGAAGKSRKMGGTIRGGNRTGGVANSGGGRLEYGSDGNARLPSEKGHPKGHYSGNVHGPRQRKGTMA